MNKSYIDLVEWKKNLKYCMGIKLCYQTSSNYLGKLRKTAFLSRAVSPYFPYPCIPVTF